MPSVEIRPDVFWIGLNDRTTDLFEGIWPVADTVSRTTRTSSATRRTSSSTSPRASRQKSTSRP